jgi:outer membrane receptor protein involved in Fe transport
VYQTGKGQTIQLKYPVNSLAQAHANYIINGSKSNASYSNYFPSLALNYDVTNSIIARISGGHTVGRPDLTNIYPSLNLPDPTLIDPTTVTSIRANNPALSPWTSNNIGLSLEYYAPDGRSNFTVRGYRRFVDNAFGSRTLTAAQTAEYLTNYGIDAAEYPGSVLTTPINMPGRIATSGLEISGAYLLDKVVPHWARGVRLVYSGTRATQTGGGVMAVQFAAQNLYIVPWSAGLGVSLTRNRFSLSLNSKVNAKISAAIPGLHDERHLRARRIHVSPGSLARRPGRQLSRDPPRLAVRQRPRHHGLRADAAALQPAHAEHRQELFPRNLSAGVDRRHEGAVLIRDAPYGPV